MSYFDRHVDLSGDGVATVSVRASHLVSFDADGGTVSFNNRGLTFAPGEYAEGDKKFVSGELEFFGTPGARATCWFRF